MCADVLRVHAEHVYSRDLSGSAELRRAYPDYSFICCSGLLTSVWPGVQLVARREVTNWPPERVSSGRRWPRGWAT